MLPGARPHSPRSRSAPQRCPPARRAFPTIRPSPRPAAAPYTYSVTSGSLPAGLSLDSATGDITGTPSRRPAYRTSPSRPPIRRARNGSRSYSISVGTASLTLLPTSLPAATQGTAYSQTITAVGGTSPYTFAVSSGALPSGLTLTSGGVLSGTPTVNGSFGFIVQATDADGNAGYRTYTLDSGRELADAVAADAAERQPRHRLQPDRDGDRRHRAYTYAVTAGSLPAGLSLNTNTGTITGTPTGSGTSNFTITATAFSAIPAARPIRWSIGTNSLTLNPVDACPTARRAPPTIRPSPQPAAPAPTPMRHFRRLADRPDRSTPNTGAITGTPTGSGPSSFTISAIDPSSDNSAAGATRSTSAPIR